MEEELNEQWYKDKKIDDETSTFIQVRKDAGGNFLHLQAYGIDSKFSNRSYGFADKFTVPPVVVDALYAHEGKVYNSLATPSPVYYRDMAEAHAYVDGVQLHLKLEHSENNGDGRFILDLPAQRFGPFIAFLEDKGLLINHEGEQRFVAPLQEEE